LEKLAIEVKAAQLRELEQRQRSADWSVLVGAGAVAPFDGDREST
jgi:hypothetical protein